jgi:hypothetical protein
MQQTTKARVKLRSLISEEIYMTGAFHSLPSGELLVSTDPLQGKYSRHILYKVRYPSICAGRKLSFFLHMTSFQFS